MAPSNHDVAEEVGEETARGRGGWGGRGGGGGRQWLADCGGEGETLEAGKRRRPPRGGTKAGPGKGEASRARRDGSPVWKDPGGGAPRGVCLEKCRLWGTKPQVLKGQAQRPGAGRRKQDRGEAQVRSCPRRGAPRGRTAEGGTGQRRPGGGGRAGQAPEKPLPSPTHL